MSHILSLVHVYCVVVTLRRLMLETGSDVILNQEVTDKHGSESSMSSKLIQQHLYTSYAFGSIVGMY